MINVRVEMVVVSLTFDFLRWVKNYPRMQFRNLPNNTFTCVGPQQWEVVDG